MELTGYDIRIRLLLVCTALVLLVLVGRLGMLQLVSWGEKSADQLAAENRLRDVWEPAPRGLLLDRRGEVLARNRSQWNVEVVPADYPQKDPAASEQIVRLLTEILDVPMPRVREALEAALGERALEAVPLKDIGEDVPFEVAACVEARCLEMPGVRIGTQVRRFYPHGKLAAHLLGYVRGITQMQHDNLRKVTYPATNPADGPPFPIRDRVYALDSLVGQTGAEKLLEKVTDAQGNVIPLLQGRRGFRLYEVNAKGEPTWVVAERKPVPGATVYLTLDAKLQKAAESALDEALKGKLGVGAVVVLDPRTGEVLVMVSRPAFDLNKWIGGWTPREFRALSNDPRSPQLNHAISGSYPPGSIFKLISSCAAFSTTDLTTDDSYYCSGAIYLGRDHTRFGCWKKHGTMDYWGGMAQSCDIYFYNLVLNKSLGSDALADYARRFGLGAVTGIGLDQEWAGFVGDRRWKVNDRQESWTTGDTLHLVIGQGFINVTSLQMAVVTAAVANGGFLPQPHLVKRIDWPEWMGYGRQEVDAPEGRQVDVAPDVLEKVRRGMRLAVERTHGTAHVMQGLGVPVAGKTGSAEDRLDRPPHAWFVCYAPADEPRYAICVFIEEGGHGGTAAAPVARKILAAALGVKPTPAPGPTESD